MSEGSTVCVVLLLFHSESFSFVVVNLKYVVVITRKDRKEIKSAEKDNVDLYQ